MLSGDIPPNQTIYVKNLNEKVKKDGKFLSHHFHFHALFCFSTSILPLLLFSSLVVIFEFFKFTTVSDSFEVSLWLNLVD